MQKTKSKLVILGIVAVWILVHIPGMTYGTENLPLHQSYVGDEQSPVNGALHMLQDKSLFGLRNIKTLYYGPVFSLFAVPAVGIDYMVKYFSGDIKSADEYKNRILFDWGGIVFLIRLTAFLVSTTGLVFAFLISATRTFNPSGKTIIPILTTGLLASNFYFFEYSHFFKHWVFIVTLLLAQIYLVIRINEVSSEGEQKKLFWYWFFHGLVVITGFGISYISLMFLIVWIPILYKAMRVKNIYLLKAFFLNMLFVALGCLVVFAWHPYAFLRLFRLIGVGESIGDLGNAQSPFSLGKTSFAYYSFEVFINNIGLTIFVIVMSVYLFFKSKRELFSLPLCIFFLAGLINFLFFVLAEHHEGRYMLPTVTALVFIASFLFSKVTNKIASYAACSLFVFTILFNVAHIIQWRWIYNQGPLEKKMISELLELQQSGEKILVVNSYILGHVHTRAAYASYTERTNKTEINLYKEIMNSNFPIDTEAINAYYVSPADFEANPEIANGFDHVVVRYYPRNELNQFDFFDENLLRLWNYGDYSPSYMIIK